MTAQDLRVTYLPMRGRCEPILLLLVDANHPYTLDTIEFADWQAMKAAGDAVAPSFPFGHLPTLTFGHGARGGSETVLGETTAICEFVEKILASPGASTASPPDASARLAMILSASLSLISHLLDVSSSPTWLEPESRQHLLEKHINPYLHSLDTHLGSSFFPPLLTPQHVLIPGTSLTSAAAAAYTAICFINDIFPLTLGPSITSTTKTTVPPVPGSEDDTKVPETPKGMASKYPKCDELRVIIEDRPRIKEWLAAGKRETRWGVGEYATKEFMAESAEKYDTVEGAKSA